MDGWMDFINSLQQLVNRNRSVNIRTRFKIDIRIESQRNLEKEKKNNDLKLSRQKNMR